MRIDVNDLRFTSFSFPSNSTNPDNNITQNWMRANWVMGGDPYITYETNVISELSEYETYINANYPEIKLAR